MKNRTHPPNLIVRFLIVLAFLAGITVNIATAAGGAPPGSNENSYRMISGDIGSTGNNAATINTGVDYLAPPNCSATEIRTLVNNVDVNTVPPNINRGGQNTFENGARGDGVHLDLKEGGVGGFARTTA